MIAAGSKKKKTVIIADNEVIRANIDPQLRKRRSSLIAVAFNLTDDIYDDGNSRFFFRRSED